MPYHGPSGDIVVGGDACRRGVVLNLGCDLELADRAGCAKSSKSWDITGAGNVCRARVRFASSITLGSLALTTDDALRRAVECSGI